MKNLGHHSLKTKALSLLMAVLMIFTLLQPFAAVAAGEIEELRAAVVFSTTAPKSGAEFFMDIRVNSASLGGDGNLIEDLCVAFDLPANLAVAAEPEPFGSEFTVSVVGSHVEVNWNDTVPVGAPSQLRFILAWNAGVTVEGDDEWVDPEIEITATECVGAYATDQDGISAVQSVYPKNNNAPEHMTTEYQNVYAALLHIATVKIKSENSSGGLNMYGGTVTIEIDSAAYIAGIKHNNASIPFAEIDDTPSAGRKTIVIELSDSSLEVNGG